MGRRTRRPGSSVPGEKLRPLDVPSPLRVRADAEGRPVAVETGGAAPGGTAPGWRRVVEIREAWRIDDEWWRTPLSRLYFEVILENGARIVLFRDLAGGGWHR